jgi:hypothetical protein
MSLNHGDNRGQGTKGQDTAPLYRGGVPCPPDQGTTSVSPVPSEHPRSLERVEPSKHGAGVPRPTRRLTIGQKVVVLTVLEVGSVKLAAHRLRVPEGTIRTSLHRGCRRVGLDSLAQVSYWLGRADGQAAERRRMRGPGA